MRVGEWNRGRVLLLGPRTGAALSLERHHNIRRRHRLLAAVLSVHDGITNH